MLNLKTHASGWCVVLILAGVVSASEQAATWEFEGGVDGFTKTGGAGEVLHETANPLLGKGSLRLVLAERATELRVVSPEFPVAPWNLYRRRLHQSGDPGTDLRLAVEFQTPGGWQPGSVYRERDGGIFGTGPQHMRARLVLTLVVPGQAVGRGGMIDDVSVQPQSPLVREKGQNLLWDGGFELDRGDMTYWVTKPKIMDISTQGPRGGHRCLHIESDRTYLVFPSIPVQAGRLYRFRVWVRGSGVVWPGLHKLAPSDWDSMRIDTAQRVGWADPLVAEIKLTNDWQKVEIRTPCESERIVWFQPLLTFAGGQIDMDDAELNSMDSE